MFIKKKHIHYYYTALARDLTIFFAVFLLSFAREHVINAQWGPVTYGVFIYNAALAHVVGARNGGEPSARTIIINEKQTSRRKYNITYI